MKAHFSEVTIRDIVEETTDAYTIYLARPEGDEWNFQPGQYLAFEVEVADNLYRRAFSLSSMPGEEDLAVTIKRLPGGIVSNYLWDHLRPGNKLKVMHPMGNFILPIHPDHERHYILIGAGSGITPLMSMLKAVLYNEPASRVTLWYGNRREAHIIFKEQLNALKARYPRRFTLIHVLSQPDQEWKGLTGRLDKDQIYELISELFMVDTYAKRYYLCGPEGMMKAAWEAMDKHAIDPRFVYQEHYHVPIEKLIDEAPDPLAKGSNHVEATVSPFESTLTLTLDGNHHQLRGASDRAILDTALDAELAAPYTCKGGICTTCKARLLQGNVGMKVAIGLTEEEKEAGYILTCQAFPLTEVVDISYDV